MIKIENLEIYGWEVAIRGMRNPMNSWDKSDSRRCEDIPCEKCALMGNPKCDTTSDLEFVIGNNDLALMKKLVKAGTDHSKFMRMITVSCDITAPMYWWKEFDTYKVGTVRNSCSTMHTIAKKEFTLDDFSHEHLFNGECNRVIEVLENICDTLNRYRYIYLETKDKKYWWQMIQLLPSSYNQRATVQLNYQVLRNMYHSRKNHKLDEWREFCKWMESLPYAELIIGGTQDDQNSLR